MRLRLLAKDKILLVRIAPPFAESGKWNFPGGIIEDGEDIRAGLAREVFEETGVSCLVGAARDNFTTEILVTISQSFDATYIQGAIILQEEEILEARWFTILDAP